MPGLNMPGLITKKTVAGAALAKVIYPAGLI